MATFFGIVILLLLGRLVGRLFWSFILALFGKR